MYYGYIYLFTLIPTGRFYIGKCKYKKYDTQGELVKNYGGSGTYGKRAIARFSHADIKREILEFTLSEEDAIAKEKYYIAKYDSTNLEKGYNLSLGGTNPVLQKERNGMGKHQGTPEEKENQRRGLQNRNYGGDNNPSRRPEVRAKLSRANMGHEVSDEVKNICSEFSKNTIGITNGRSNLRARKDHLEFYGDLGLNYVIGTTKGINCIKDPTFIKITNGEVNHCIPPEDLQVGLSKGGVRGTKKNASAQRRLLMSE